MTWIAAKRGTRRWCHKKRNVCVCEGAIEREMVLKYTLRLSSAGWLRNVQNIGEQLGSNAWGAYITKFGIRDDEERG